MRSPPAAKKAGRTLLERKAQPQIEGVAADIAGGAEAVVVDRHQLHFAKLIAKHRADAVVAGAAAAGLRAGGRAAAGVVAQLVFLVAAHAYCPFAYGFGDGVVDGQLLTGLVLGVRVAEIVGVGGVHAQVPAIVQPAQRQTGLQRPEAVGGAEVGAVRQPARR